MMTIISYMLCVHCMCVCMSDTKLMYMHIYTCCRRCGCVEMWRVMSDDGDG